MYDVVVIGAGVIGTMVARELSRYNASVCVLEKESDVAMGATCANSAIVHAGFDAKEGSLKARFNVEGSKMMEKVARELNVKYKRNGSLVIALSEEEMEHVRKLYLRGVKNGVEDLSVIGKEELRRIEPGITDAAIGALYAPTGAIVCPYELAIAAMGNAMDNGAELVYEFCVKNISYVDKVYTITDGEREIKAKFVVNCAGVYSDKIARMAGDESFSVHARRGEYQLLDKEFSGLVNCTIFRTPSKMGKGILVSPTVDGNTILGPTSEDIEEKDNTETTMEGLAKVSRECLESVPSLPRQGAITSFCGLRAVGSTGDFIINEKDGFVNCAGIESPGLTSAPAIAKYVAELLKNAGMTNEEKAEFNPCRESTHAFRSMSIEEKNKVIAKKPAFGKIVCRCEQVTEGEIVEAIKKNPPAMTVDAVKRRTRSGMGRCQGGFCLPSVMSLLARERGISPLDVTKSGVGSNLNLGRIK